MKNRSDNSVLRVNNFKNSVKNSVPSASQSVSFLILSKRLECEKKLSMADASLDVITFSGDDNSTLEMQNRSVKLDKKVRFTDDIVMKDSSRPSSIPVIEELRSFLTRSENTKFQEEKVLGAVLCCSNLPYDQDVMKSCAVVLKNCFDEVQNYDSGAYELYESAQDANELQKEGNFEFNGCCLIH